EPTTLRLPGRVDIKLQLMKASDLPRWPTERCTIIQRYSDAPHSTLTVYTPSAFAAAKTLAWSHRAASRDLYDLWALALLGVIDGEACEVFRRLAGLGEKPGSWMFRDAPTDDSWHAALSHQGRLRVGPGQAMQTVASA